MQFISGSGWLHAIPATVLEVCFTSLTSLISWSLHCNWGYTFINGLLNSLQAIQPDHIVPCLSYSPWLFYTFETTTMWETLIYYLTQLQAWDVALDPSGLNLLCANPEVLHRMFHLHDASLLLVMGDFSTIPNTTLIVPAKHRFTSPRFIILIYHSW